jgi:hypothetical protein
MFEDLREDEDEDDIPRVGLLGIGRAPNEDAGKVLL